LHTQRIKKRAVGLVIQRALRYARSGCKNRST
jgi:hypothetical protein